MQNKHQKLNNVLCQISSRLSRNFFLKLLLFEKDPPQEERRVRNYDIESEAAETVASIIDTKVKATYLKFMHLFKQAADNYGMGDRHGTSKTISSQFHQIDHSVRALKEKVKELNSRAETRFETERAALDSKKLSKLEKRKRILARLCALQNQLQQLSTLRQSESTSRISNRENSRIQYFQGMNRGSQKNLRERYAIRW